MFFFITMFTNCSSGIKSYQNGDYEKAAKQLKSSTTNGSYVDAWDYWFLGLSYEKIGRLNNAEEAKIKAFNKYQNDYDSVKAEFKKKYPEELEEMLAWGEKKLEEQKRTENVGTWTLYSIYDRVHEKNVSSSAFYTSIHAPKQHITLTKDGRIAESIAGNKTFDTWIYDENAGFMVLNSKGEKTGGINKQGYLQINFTSLDSRGIPMMYAAFYTKD